MTQWATFVGLTGVVCALLLLLSHATKTTLTEPAVPGSGAGGGVDAGIGSRSRTDSPSDRSIDRGDDSRSDFDPGLESGRDSNSNPNSNSNSNPNSTPDSASNLDTEPTSAPETPPSPARSRTDDRESTTIDDSAIDSRPNPNSNSSSSASTDRRRDGARGLEGGDGGDDGVELGADDGDGERPSAETGERASESSSRTGAGSASPGMSGSRNREREYATRMESMSTGALLANVAFSQGLFAAVLIGAALYAEIPADALGIAFTRTYLVTGVLLGTGIGIALYVANELGAVIATRAGIDHSEELREVLAPDSPGGWLILLLAVLPIVAIFEEFLFRAALVGATSSGFGVSPWLLAVVSSIAFALGHGMQGPAGVAVTGALGFVLAVVFIVTGSFLVVVVAHYLVNAFEFVIHEGLELEWTGGGADVGGSGSREQ